MKMKAFFFVVLYVSCVVSHGEAAYKCKAGIVKAIKEYWGDNVPKNIAAANEAAGLEAVVETTENYYPEGTKYVSSIFKGDKVNITIVPSKGMPTTNTYTVEESEGTTYSPGSTVVMYQILNKDGIRACYKCDKDENATEGTSEAFIKANGKYKKTAWEEAEKLLKKLGFKLTKKYPTTCP